MKIIMTRQELLTSGMKFMKGIPDKRWRQVMSQHTVVVCTHNLQEWDCGCTFGCQSCKNSYYCPDCSWYFTEHNKDYPLVKVDTPDIWETKQEYKNRLFKHIDHTQKNI